MTIQLSDQALQAIVDLDIDVPILRVETAKDGTVTLYLYGGQIKTWKPRPKPARAKPQASKSRSKTK